MKLKNSVNKRVAINYYSGTRCLKNQSFRLLDVINFSDISVNKGQKNSCINFFGPNTIIESITIDGETEPIYFNPYIQRHINRKSRTIDYEESKKEFFKDWKPTEDLEERWGFTQDIKERGDFDLIELFLTDKQLDDFEKFFDQIVLELMEYAEKHGLDSNLIQIGKGFTSVAYSVGDKILKIGKPRTCSTIPYCEYLLQPIINRDFEFDSIPLHIEVTEKVITCKDNPKLESEFEDIIKDFEQKFQAIGLRYDDFLPQNIGILMKDNIIHFDSIPFETGNACATSINHNNSLQIRKKGEPVILDLDTLVVEDIQKYCEYLRSIGFSEDKIKEVKDFYGFKRK